MWLFTIHGFFSIVQKGEDCFHIRSRHKRDLVNLIDLTGLKKTTVEKSFAGSDYPWRIIVSKLHKDLVIVALGTDIEYSNFKAAVAAEPDQADKLSAYHEVWEVVRKSQLLSP